jgi:hypothetical protein
MRCRDTCVEIGLANASDGRRRPAGAFRHLTAVRIFVDHSGFRANVLEKLVPLVQTSSHPRSIEADILSQGLHAKSDDECIGFAVTVREVFEVLINQIDTNKSAAKVLAESTRKLLTMKSAGRK